MKDNNHIEQEYKEIKTDRVMELFFVPSKANHYLHKVLQINIMFQLVVLPEISII